MNIRSRVAAVVFFGVAMAWMESAAVAYLRTLLHRVEPYQISPLPIDNVFGSTEVIREAATVVILLTLSWLAGNSRRSKIGYFMIAFGIWDIFYYLFLRMIVGWPHSLFDWDVLFLIPLPWWGPVLSPILISVILILTGMLLVRTDGTESLNAPSASAWMVSAAGAAVALYVFMSDAIRTVLENGKGIHSVLPTHFKWPLFILSLLLMSMPVLQSVMRLIHNRGNEQ